MALANIWTAKNSLKNQQVTAVVQESLHMKQRTEMETKSMLMITKKRLSYSPKHSSQMLQTDLLTTVNINTLYHYQILCNSLNLK